MKITYDKETDSMYINFSDQPAIDSDEVANGIVLDFNDAGIVVGIDIQHASTIANINKIIFEQSSRQAA